MREVGRALLLVVMVAKNAGDFVKADCGSSDPPLSRIRSRPARPGREPQALGSARLRPRGDAG